MDAKKAIALLFAICFALLLSLFFWSFYGGAQTGLQVMAMPSNAATGGIEYAITFPFTLYLILACLLVLFALLLQCTRIMRNEKKGK